MARMTVSILNGKINLSEGGKNGGNAREAVGHRIVWLRDPQTVATFALKFERLEEGDGTLASVKDWPFDSVKAKPNNSAVIDDIDCEVSLAEKVAVRLGNDPGVFKYTVEVVPAQGVGQAPPLDPVIIVRN